MKKLAEFKDEAGLEVAAALLEPISKIAANAANVEARGQSVIEFASAMLRNSPEEVKTILAIMDEQNREEYHYSAGTVLAGLVGILGDPDMMALFGLRSQTPDSSGYALESIGANGG